MKSSNGHNGPNLDHTRKVGERCPVCDTMTIGIVELSWVPDYTHIEVTTSGAGDEVADLHLISDNPDRPPVTICLTRYELEELTKMVLAATEEDDAR
jgi:hypothetical protein